MSDPIPAIAVRESMTLAEVRDVLGQYRAIPAEKREPVHMPRYVILENVAGHEGKELYLDTLDPVDASLIRKAVQTGKNPTVFDYNRAHLAEDKRMMRREKRAKWSTNKSST